MLFVRNWLTKAMKRAFSDTLLVRANELELTRSELAKAAQISRSHLQALLAARRHVSLIVLVLLADALQMHPAKLLRLTLINLRRLRRDEENTAKIRD